MPRSESAFKAVGIDNTHSCDFYSGSKDADKAAGFRLVPGLGALKYFASTFMRWQEEFITNSNFKKCLRSKTTVNVITSRM